MNNLSEQTSFSSQNVTHALYDPNSRSLQEFKDTMGVDVYPVKLDFYAEEKKDFDAFNRIATRLVAPMSACGKYFSCIFEDFENNQMQSIQLSDTERDRFIQAFHKRPKINSRLKKAMKEYLSRKKI